MLGETIDPRRLIGTCTAAEKQLALLVRVLSRDARLVVLDEPTTALTPPEVERLFAIIRRLAGQGMTFIFVSHMLEELIQLSDSITVLRDGRNVGSLEKAELEAGRLSALIAGRTVARSGHRAPVAAGRPRLEVDRLGLEGAFADVSFQLQAGEILGVAGLQGSGKTALLRSLFASPPASTGTIHIDGKAVSLTSAAAAMAAGIGYVPEDRKALGLFAELDVKLNIGMAGLSRWARHGLVGIDALRHVASQMREALSIKLASVDAPIRSLSGGNQQKVLIARWLALKPRILVMNEPTRGVDVGAKQEIIELIRALAADGCTCVVSSAALEELLQVSNRIVVLNRGRVAAVLAAETATKEQVILAATT